MSVPFPKPIHDILLGNKLTTCLRLVQKCDKYSYVTVLHSGSMKVVAPGALKWHSARFIAP